MKNFLNFCNPEPIGFCESVKSFFRQKPKFISSAGLDKHTISSILIGMNSQDAVVFHSFSQKFTSAFADENHRSKV